MYPVLDIAYGIFPIVYGVKSHFPMDFLHTKQNSRYTLEVPVLVNRLFPAKVTITYPAHVSLLMIMRCSVQSSSGSKFGKPNLTELLKSERYTKHQTVRAGQLTGIQLVAVAEIVDEDHLHQYSSSRASTSPTRPSTDATSRSPALPKPRHVG